MDEKLKEKIMDTAEALLDYAKNAVNGVDSEAVADVPGVVDAALKLLRHVNGDSPEMISPLESLRNFGLDDEKSLLKALQIIHPGTEPKRVNDLRPVVKQLLHVLVNHQVPMSSLERVLELLKDAAYTSTPVQEIWTNDDYAGYKNL